MNETERELKELLERKAREAQASPLAPPGVLKRSRRRQLATAIVGGGTTIAFVLAAILGAQGLLRGGTTSQPASESARQRTVVVAGLTVTSPSDWTLIDDWPSSLRSVTATCSNAGTCTAPEPDTGPNSVPGQLPILQLTNFDPGLQRTVCGNISWATGGAVLYIGNDFILSGPDRIGGITSNKLDLSTDPVTGPCGIGYYAIVGTTGFFAFAAFGPDASVEDQQQVLDSFNGLNPTRVPGEVGQLTTPGYVLAGGTDERGPWRVEIRPAQDAKSGFPLEMSLVRDNKGSFLVGVGPTTSDAIQYENSDGIWFGAVPANTISLEFTPNDGGTAIPATLLDLPPTLEANALGFVLVVPGNVEGQLEGSTPTSGFAVGTATAVGPSPVNQPPTGGSGNSSVTAAQGLPIANGSDLGTRWTLTVDPNGKAHFALAPTTTNADNFMVAVTPGQEVDYAGVPAPEGAFIVAVASSSAGAISVHLPDGSVVDGQSYPAPKEVGRDQVFWVIALSGSGHGTLESESGGVITSIDWQPAVFAAGTAATPSP